MTGKIADVSSLVTARVPLWQFDGTIEFESIGVSVWLTRSNYTRRQVGGCVGRRTLKDGEAAIRREKRLKGRVAVVQK